MIGGISLSYLFLYAPYNFWTGGFNWGPRFLLPVIPLLILPLGTLLEDRIIIGGRAAFYSLFCMGLLIQVPAILVDHSRYLFSIIEGDDAVTYADTVFEVQHSPLMNQWPTAIERMKAYLNPESKDVIMFQRNSIKDLAPDIQNGQAILISDFLRRNTLDLWWLNLPAW